MGAWSCVGWLGARVVGGVLACVFVVVPACVLFVCFIGCVLRFRFLCVFLCGLFVRFLVFLMDFRLPSFKKRKKKRSTFGQANMTLPHPFAVRNTVLLDVTAAFKLAVRTSH
jgi:chromate transport protein ChrA